VKFVRVVEADWGGKAHEVSGALELYGWKFEWVRLKSGAHLKRMCDEAVADPKKWTLVLLSEGLVNQFGLKIPDKVPPEAGNLRVLWIDVPAPRGVKVLKERRVAEDGPIDEAALVALGETTDRKHDILKALRVAAGKRFSCVDLHYGEFGLYLSESDIEFHLSICDVVEQFDRGSLKPWVKEIIKEAEERRRAALK
jgi:hypothetical protein